MILYWIIRIMKLIYLSTRKYMSIMPLWKTKVKMTYTEFSIWNFQKVFFLYPNPLVLTLSLPFFSFLSTLHWVPFKPLYYLKYLFSWIFLDWEWNFHNGWQQMIWTSLTETTTIWLEGLITLFWVQTILLIALFHSPHLSHSSRKKTYSLS